MHSTVGSAAGMSPAPEAHSEQAAGSEHANQVPANSNVAVIAIHGVGRHAVGASADAVSTLLLALENDENAVHPKPPYSGFVSTSIDVPLRPVRSPHENVLIANQRNQPSLWKRVIGIFDERRGFLAHVRKNAEYDPPGYDRDELRPNEPDRGEYGYQFMITQIAGYEGEVDRNFQTIRLEGKREGGDNNREVHIYDAHYSDLTKPQSNILAFFFAFYQLLFHLASLSLMAVYWAEAENRKADHSHERRWRIESSIHATSVRFLTMFIPILNVILLEIGCCAFIDKVKGAWPAISSLALAALVSVVTGFLFLRRRGSPSRPFLWALVPLVSAGIGTLTLTGLACLYNRLSSLSNLFSTLLLFDWLILAGVLLGLVAVQFNQLRPGAYFLSVFLYVVNVFLFLVYLLPNAPRVVQEHYFATASLWAIRLIFAELVASWIVCLVNAFVSWPLSAWCVRGIKDAPLRKARAIAAFRTGRFAFAVPAILFVIVTCALWSGILVQGSYKLKAFAGVAPGNFVSCDEKNSPDKWRDNRKSPYSLLVPDVGAVENWMGRAKASLDMKCESTPSADFWHVYLTGLLVTSVTPSLPITMSLFTLGLFLLIWAVLPSIVFELKPEETRNARTAEIRSLGSWLSRGLDNIAILTRMYWFAIVPIPLLFFGVDWYAVHRHVGLKLFASASQPTLQLIERTGAILAIAGAAIFASILKYSTTILDAILDVDNYLRTSPLDQTPRARIAERIVSLLRYIAAYRDGNGRPYSKLIIVAHSLGTMVTTDLLRYLERSARDAPDPELSRYQFRQQKLVKGESKLPIYVFSMGSPLRQLLNRFFPHLYWWVCDQPDNSLSPLSAPLPSPPEIRFALPRSDELNVAEWSNAYRSGDYIGRWLWAGQWLQRNGSDNPDAEPDSARKAPPQACYEMCIGLGAHTHYWDRSASDVAHRLDQLIV